MKTKPCTAVFVRSIGTGGAEKYSILLARALSQSSKTHLIVLRSSTTSPRHFAMVEKGNISLTFLGGNMIQKTWKGILFLRKHRPTVIFSHLPSDTFFAAILGRLCGVTYILGGIQNSRFPRLKRTVLKYVHNYLLDYSISNSHAGKHYLSQFGFKPKTILVIPNAIDIDQPLRHHQASSVIRLITVARFVEQKDYLCSIQAIAKLRERLPHDIQLSYDIVGFGKLEPILKRWIEQYGLSDMVHVHLKPDNIPELLNRADIYISSSRFEGLSNSIMEAMLASLPIVATQVGDTSNLVDDGKNGYLYPSGDVKMLESKLHTLLINPDMRSRFGEASYFKLATTYTFERFQERISELMGGIFQSDRQSALPKVFNRPISNKR